MSAETTDTNTVAAEQPPVPSVDMPEGCRCGFKWRVEGDSEGFLWNYQTVCPVAPKDHTAVWRPFFRHIIDSGSGGGQAPGGAQIIINDGRWRHAPNTR
ncbi:hypothetical protein VFPBJ_11774 [Purpureocillium lilacinum]|uniref:Uncharacterized protein n=1 Tax=Purpureocillium lilacinum TaxID=33203 RepID=A0A179EVP0_PURLI|nr:hypothetical protein VFPBJ_11774 [Purpureocillium lilacinum]